VDTGIYRYQTTPVRMVHTEEEDNDRSSDVMHNNATSVSHQHVLRIVTSKTNQCV